MGDEFVFLLVAVGIVFLLLGPAALVLGIIALCKVNNLIRQLQQKDVIAKPIFTYRPAGGVKKEFKRPEVVKEEPTIEAVRPEVEIKEEAKPVRVEPMSSFAVKGGSLEQRIGTRWVLVAGIITVIVGVGYFLRYAYDNELIGPVGRVIIAVVAGIAALVIGEVTRRRGYGVVAKGVTALGFAILYAADFSAYRLYGLIESPAAFIFAIAVTAAAMVYAVTLNEVLVAFLSLLGGYLTPLIISTGENMPGPLFSYVLVLSIGAMLCAYYRKWETVNIVAFVGTFLLYTGWFEKFYRPAMDKADGAPEQMGVAIGWLGVFFVIYLLMPVLYGLVNKAKSRKQDVMLILGNAIVVFYYLGAMLYSDFRAELAFSCVGLSAVHLILMGVVTRRCRDDEDLQLSLLVIGLALFTVAVPLYLKMYAVVLAWVCEGVVLAFVGLRYRSKWTQAGAAIALILSVGKLLLLLPLHSGEFRLALNADFGTWVFAAAAIFVYHLLYRKSDISEGTKSFMSQVSYIAGWLVLFAAALMEWGRHCNLNMVFSGSYYFRGTVLLFTVFMLLLVLRRVCPKGIMCKLAACLTVITGTFFVLAEFSSIHKDSFIAFVNIDFAMALLFVSGAFAVAGLVYRFKADQNEALVAMVVLLTSIFAVLILLTEEIYTYWYCKNEYWELVKNWKFLAHMYISVAWAAYGAVLMVVGFWKDFKALRYIALGLFAILLGKVFIVDTAAVKNVYRIAAFLATGVTLVSVSYLYQFLKNKGFFDKMLIEKKQEQ